jgi:hypothetical protein
MRRSNFVVILVFAAGALGLVLWLTRPGLASDIEGRGGKLIVESQTPDGPTASVIFIGRPIGDADLLFLRDRKNFNRLFLDSTRVTGEFLADLNGCDQLRWLSLGNCPITDAGLKGLPALPRLELLNLDRTRITDAGLAELQRLKGLQRLYLMRTAVTDAGLEHLKGLNQLVELQALETRVTVKGIRRLQESIPGLTKVQIGKDDD